MVVGIRNIANRYLGAALQPVQRIMDAIIHRLEVEDLVQRRGIINSGNVHFSGTLPAARANVLMQRIDPPPSWLSKGTATKNSPLKPDEERDWILKKTKEDDYPELDDSAISSFSSITAAQLTGPMKLYRVVSPSNLGASADWMSEEVFNAIRRSPDPKSAWRKQLAVWPDWNANGQFVIYELKAGEKLNVWKGTAAAQAKHPKELPDRYLEGGFEQIKFDARIAYRPDGSIPRVNGKPVTSLGDKTQYFEVDHRTGVMKPSSMTRDDWQLLPASEQVKYTNVRAEITNDRIVGPMDTGWGSTDFDSQLQDVRLGVPNLSGQRINR
ncbi:hypothetical protein [Stenotrophomonas humi]